MPTARNIMAGTSNIRVPANYYRKIEKIIENHKPPSKEKLEQRFSRCIKVEGMDIVRKYVESWVLVAGVGAVTTHFIESAIRKGINLIICDFDVVSLHNLERTAMFTEDDARARRPKVLSVANFVKKVNSDAAVIPLYADFGEFALSSIANDFLPKAVKVIVTGLDNGEALYNAWKWSIMHNIPHVDGSTWMHSAHCFTFPEPHQVCYLCTVPISWYEQISAAYSCTRETMNGVVLPSYAVSSKIAGDLILAETLRLLRGESPHYNEIRIVAGDNDWHFEREAILPSPMHEYGHIFATGEALQ